MKQVKKYLLGYYVTKDDFRIVDTSYQEKTLKLKKALYEKNYKRKYTIIMIHK